MPPRKLTRKPPQKSDLADRTLAGLREDFKRASEKHRLAMVITCAAGSKIDKNAGKDHAAGPDSDHPIRQIYGFDNSVATLQLRLTGRAELRGIYLIGELGDVEAFARIAKRAGDVLWGLPDDSVPPECLGAFKVESDSHEIEAFVIGWILMVHHLAMQDHSDSPLHFENQMWRGKEFADYDKQPKKSRRDYFSFAADMFTSSADAIDILLAAVRNDEVIPKEEMPPAKPTKAGRKLYQYTLQIGGVGVGPTVSLWRSDDRRHSVQVYKFEGKAAIFLQSLTAAKRDAANYGSHIRCWLSYEDTLSILVGNHAAKKQKIPPMAHEAVRTAIYRNLPPECKPCDIIRSVRGYGYQLCDSIQVTGAVNKDWDHSTEPAIVGIGQSKDSLTPAEEKMRDMIKDGCPRDDIKMDLNLDDNGYDLMLRRVTELTARLNVHPLE